MDSNVANLLRTARARTGLTQRALGEAAHTSGATVAAYESGTKDPRATTLFRLLAAAGSEVTAVPRRSRNDRFVDLLCERIAQRVLDAPHVVDAAREVLGRFEGRSSWTDAWRCLLDAGPIACAAVLTSTSPDARPLKTDNPFAMLGLVSEEEREALRAQERGR